MDLNGVGNNDLQEKKPEMIKFEVSKKQLIGEPRYSPIGGQLQNILFADGWVLNRPVAKLHETENGKIAFWLAKYKKDGTVNEITLRRSRCLEETDGNGKPLYKQEKITVKVSELKDIEKFGKEKYRFQKEAENKQQIKKKNPEHFEVVEKGDLAEEPFAIKNSETGALLMSEEGVPYNFASEQLAQIFAKKANEVALDGLKIRTFKDKEFALCKIAVQQNGLALAFIKNQTLELCLDAVQQNPNAVVLVDKKYQDEVSKRMSGLIFHKLCCGEVKQSDVIDHLFTLDDKSEFTLRIATESGRNYEISAGKISPGIGKREDGINEYTACLKDVDITFTDKNIENVMYKGMVAASYEPAGVNEQEMAETQPRRRVAKTI